VKFFGYHQQEHPHTKREKPLLMAVWRKPLRQAFIFSINILGKLVYVCLAIERD
jgi:hypothetical protein